MNPRPKERLSNADRHSQRNQSPRVSGRSGLELVAHGHKVIVERGAGGGIGAHDADYEAVGAELVDTAEEVYTRADMIVKVKEPQVIERRLLREGQILFTYLHLAPDPQQCKDLVASGAICIAYETVTQPGGGLPLLAPMSEVAGRMSIQVGAHYLEREHGGRGILLGGVPGVAPAKVVILGAGVVGWNAAQIAIGNRAQVVVIDTSVDALHYVDRSLGAQVTTVCSYCTNITEYLLTADVAVGCALIPGGVAPKLVDGSLVSRMKPGSVVVDVAIDQGGRFETSRPTTHAEPTYVVDGVCIIALPICQGQCRIRLRMRSTTPPCRSYCKSPTRAGVRRWWIIHISRKALTSALAR